MQEPEHRPLDPTYFLDEYTQLSLYSDPLSFPIYINFPSSYTFCSVFPILSTPHPYIFPSRLLKPGPLPLPEAGRGLFGSTNQNAALALPGPGSPLIGWLLAGPQALSQGWRGLLVVIMMRTTLSCALLHPDSPHTM